MQIVQLTGPSVVQPQAPFDVELGIQVQNLSNEPITLRRVQMQQVGRGSWVLQSSVAGVGANRPLNFNTVIAPGTEQGVSFWLHAYYVASPGGLNENEPVTLRAVVYFESPSGPFHEIVQTLIDQWR